MEQNKSATPEELGKLVALTEAATPGPWRASGRYIGNMNHMSCVGEVRDENGNWSDTARSTGNAAYIAAANPAAILRIAALVAQQAARIDELERDLKDAQTQLLGPDLSVKFEAAKVELNAAILATQEGK